MTLSTHTMITSTARRKAVWGPKRTLAAVFVAVLACAGSASAAAGPRGHFRVAPRARAGRPNSLASSYKIDRELSFRSKYHNASAKTRVIVELKSGAQVPAEFKMYKRPNGQLRIIGGHVLDLPNRLIARMALHPDVFRMHFDRPTSADNYRTALTTGTRVVQETLGLTGAGIGVAVIDSGITNWHNDLTDPSASGNYPWGNQRVAAFVDFVNEQASPYDDFGHGTHVAGIIAGNGTDSNGQKAGSAPGASLVVLKVLDAQGAGSISRIIQALDWVLVNHAAYNIRVVNMSVGAKITESYWTDPMTIAVKRVVDAGIVVVAAAGNRGSNDAGQPQWGAIGAPGNAPWAITVGASSTMGTPERGDDTMARFSSRGPTFLDWSAKPDLVAPGAGAVSLAAPGSTLVTAKPMALLPGSTGATEYLSLSGTSMATPVVSGVVALMLQANPSLTPNAVKAILQYTAQEYPDYKPLEQGAGFLNAVGAVRLARFYASATPGQPMPDQTMWSKHILWGNHSLTGGVLDPSANAFAVGTNWGVAATSAGDNIVWGTSAADDNIVWGTSAAGDNIVWGTSAGDDNIVWGTDCGGADCDNIVWGTSDADNIVWGTASGDDNIVWGTSSDPDNVVWGTSGDDNVVWGTSDDDNIVWGTSDDDNIVWGTSGDDNIVWGTASDDDNIVWGTSDGDDNIVWGTNGDDNIVWGTSDDDNIVWGTSGSLSHVWEESPDGTKVQLGGAQVFDTLSDGKLLRLIETVHVQLVTPPAPPVPPSDPPPAPPSDPAPTDPPPAPTSDPGTTTPAI
jgi:serine protease AprX